MSSVLERIQSAALAHGDRLAHEGEGRSMTYRELWGRACALASVILRQGEKGEQPIVIKGHKAPEMLVGFLGATLAGRSYVPLDSSLPEARTSRIIATAAPLFVWDKTAISDLTRGWEHLEPVPLPARSDTDPFYIIFTSGSTGEPKGVVITHGCLAAFVDWMLAEQCLAGAAPEVFLNQAPFSFDLSVMDLYLSLATGSTLVSLTKDEIANPRDMYARLRRSGITTWVSTPSFAQMCLVEKTFNATMLPGLRRFLFCGETLAHKTAAALLERFPDAAVWNTYGPTEATVATTSVRVDAALLDAHDPLPIGRPRPGTEVLIRREDGGIARDHERGEIIIRGPNVSPGYLARPDLTDQAFFHADGHRGYRTGDRGWTSGGMLFFDGRMDFQVKVRGHRIELGDVESHVRELPGVVDAVVVPVERRGVCDSLAAFVVMREPPAEADEFSAARTLRDALAHQLPDYMIPRKMVFLHAFPLTPNGKADRRQLAASLA